MSRTHQRRVLVEKTQPKDGKKDIEGFDAIVSNVQGVTIGLSVADCVPVLLYDPVHNAVGVVHAGLKLV